MKQLYWPRTTPSKADVKAQNAWKLMHSHQEGKDVQEHGFTVNCYSKVGFMKSWKDPAAFWEWPMRDIRGLVINHDGAVIARGIPKFFGADDGYLGDWKPEFNDLNITLMEKFDGACIHVWYHPDHGVRFTTKGGAGHEFEEWAEREWNAGRVHGIPDFDPEANEPPIGRTLIFELIVPEDEHVVPLGGNAVQGLHFLGHYNLQADYYVPNVLNYSGRIMNVDSYEALIDQFESIEDFEGWAVLLHDDVGVIHDMLKVKCEWYMQRRLAQRIREKATSDKMLWRQFVVDSEEELGIVYDKQYAIDVLEDFFDDWYTDNVKTLRLLEQQFTEQIDAAITLHQECHGLDRKSFVEKVQESNIPLPLAMAVWDESSEKAERFFNSKSTWNQVCNIREKQNRELTDADLKEVAEEVGIYEY